MTSSLYDAAVTPCAQQLGALAGIIDKAAAHCAANKIEEAVLLQDRLYPDMFSLARQIRQAADFGVNTGGRLAGVTPPAMPAVDDTSFADAKSRVETALGFVKTLKPAPARRRGGQGRRVDRGRQRTEAEGQRLSAAVRAAEFLLLRDDGVRHLAPSRRAGRQAGLPRPGQLALMRGRCYRPLMGRLPHSGVAMPRRPVFDRKALHYQAAVPVARCVHRAVVDGRPRPPSHRLPARSRVIALQNRARRRAR